MDLREIDKKLLVEYANKRAKNEQVASENLKKANSLPAFRELDRLEHEIILELSKEKAKDKPNKSEIKGMTEALARARKEKTVILGKLKLKPSDLEVKYDCKICKDTGMVDGDYCSCYKKRQNQEIIKASGLLASENECFENFDASIYSDPAQAENAEKLKNILFDWTEKFPKVKKQNIVVCGKTGVGKTYLSKCVANQLRKKDISICYVSANEMNNMFLKYHTTFDSGKLTILAPLLESEVLIIDDLGTEPLLKNVTVNYLYQVISERDRFKRSNIVTTNLLPENVLDRYGERIYSRLFSKLSTLVFHLSGKDLRID